MIPGFWIKGIWSIIHDQFNSKGRNGVCVTWCIEVFYNWLIFCHFVVVEIYQWDFFFLSPFAFAGASLVQYFTKTSCLLFLDYSDLDTGDVSANQQKNSIKDIGIGG